MALSSIVFILANSSLECTELLMMTSFHVSLGLHKVAPEILGSVFLTQTLSLVL